MMERVSHCVMSSMRLAKRGSFITSWNNQPFSVLGHPAGDAFSHFEPHVFEGFRRRPHRDGKVEFVRFLIHHEQGPSVRTEVFRHLFHDGLQDRIQVQ